jgi:NADPH2:quinone reductase
MTATGPAHAETMQALVLGEFGAPLEPRTVTRPVPQAGEVLVRIAASGVNPLDTKIRAGGAQHARVRAPAILGMDLAGVVTAVGPEVSRFKPGDEVYGMTGGVGDSQGSLAEYAAVDADLLAIKPARLSMAEAAALPLSVITAWEGLVDRAAAGSGHAVLVQGGAGGVGHVAVQIAVARGAMVWATGRPENFRLIRGCGAQPMNYKTASVDDYLAVSPSGEGFDIIFDTVGGATLDQAFQSVRPYTGHVVSILGWGTHSLAPLSFRGATYSGVFTLLPLLTGRGRAHHGQILTQAAALVQAGQLTPRLDPGKYHLDSVMEAHKAVETGSAKGKVVVTL